MFWAQTFVWVELFLDTNFWTRNWIEANVGLTGLNALWTLIYQPRNQFLVHWDTLILSFYDLNSIGRKSPRPMKIICVRGV